MATEPDNWIQQSLTRLETLELEREQHERALESVTEPQDLKVHSEAIERLDEEIRRLYEVLEAVASEQEQTGDGDSEMTATNEFHQPSGELQSPVGTANQQPPMMAAAAVQQPVVTPQPVAPQPIVQPPIVQAPGSHFAQPPFAQPVAAPPVAAAPIDDDFDPFGPPSSSTSMGASPAASAPGSVAALGPIGVTGEQPIGHSPFDAPNTAMIDDIDMPSSGGGAFKWVAIVLLVLGGGGVGAYLYTQQQAKDAPAPAAAPAGPAQVISATPVPPDTQGPNVAKGGEATVTPGTEIRPSGRGGNGGGGNHQAQAGENPQQGHGVEVKETDDPLGGLN